MILIIGDQPEVTDIWSHGLVQRGITVETADLGDQSTQFFVDGHYELGIIDINDSGCDIAPLCRSIRAVFDNPILVFTYEHDERFHLRLYDEGVDECITKPIGVLLLLAKVTAWLARSSTPRSQARQLYYGGFHLNTSGQLLTTPDGRTVKLSNLEYRLIVLLLANKGRSVPADVIVSRVWSEYEANTNDLLKRLIYRLRRKIELEPGSPQYIETVDGFGYRVSYIDE